MPSLRSCLLFALLALHALSICAETGERVALVIGNSSYPKVPLLNPRNDAQGMTTLLRQAGFVVDQQLDTTKDQLSTAVSRFGATIKDPKVKFALFYYAGHGLQQDWRNYLVPVSAEIKSAADVRNTTVDVSDLLAYMDQAKGRSFLVILDACRDDPFSGAYRPPAKGLSQFDAPVGSLLAYSTAPGSVAQDGEGENGLYTSHLLREFAVRGTRLEDAFKRVRLNVRLASQGQQIPWESTSLEDDVYLFPSERAKLSDAEQDQLLEQEIKSWLRVRSTTDYRQLANFIREYPSGSASELAQARLNRLMTAEARRNAQGSIQIASLPGPLVRDSQARPEPESGPQAAAQAEAQRAEAARLETARLAEQQQALRLDAARVEAQRVAAAQQEAARLEAERMALQRAETARLEQQQLAQSRARAAELEAQRVAAERALREAELARADAERLAASRLQAQRLEQAQREAARQEEQALSLRRAQAARLEEQQQQQARARAAELEAQRVAALRAVQEAEAERSRQQQQEEAAPQEAARLAAERDQAAATVIAAVTPSTATTEPAPDFGASIAATPYFKGYQEHQRVYRPGDVFNYQVLDVFTRASKPLSLQVTAVDVDGDRVEYNNGEYLSDTMGNIIGNPRGGFNTPRQFYPAELYVGKKWRTVFKQSRLNGIVYTYRYDMKVVGRETIAVPAGTFDTFKIEARGFNMQLNARLERNIWVAPGVSGDIAHEILVRLRNGVIEQNDRQELVSYRQAVQRTAAR